METGPTDRVLDSPEHPCTKLLLGSVSRRGWDASLTASGARLPE
ncbi:hypothetical protein [Streptomyces sp. NPDC018352]